MAKEENLKTLGLSMVRKIGVLLGATAIVIVMIFANRAGGQWRQLNVGGTPPPVDAMIAVHGNLVAGTTAGIFLSTDGGSHWNNVYSAQGLCFTSDDSAIFAGTPTGIAYSTDGGASWAALNPELNYEVQAIQISGTLIIAGTIVYGVFRSTDGGASWVASDSGLSGVQHNIDAIALCGDKILLGTQGGLCVSTDEGEVWSTISNGSLSPTQFIFSISVQDSLVFAGAAGGVFRSTDDGATWIEVNHGLQLPNETPQILSINIGGGTVFAATASGAFHSTDLGEDWEADTNGLPYHETFMNSILLADSTVYAGTLFGVYVSTNNGASWSSANSGMVGADVFNLSGNGQAIFARMDSNLYASPDNGATWAIADNGIAHLNIQSIAVGDSSAFAVADNSLYASRNNGESWQRVTASRMDTAVVTAVVFSGLDILVAAGKGGVYSSSDNGADWTYYNGDLPATGCMAASGSSVFAATQQGIYFSVNNVRNWLRANASITDAYVLSVGSSGLFAATFGYDNPYSPPVFGILRSTDNGVNWQSFMSGLPYVDFEKYTPRPVLEFATHGSDDFLAYDSAILESHNGSTGWTNISSGLPARPVYSVYVNDSTVFVGTGGAGIWERPVSQVTAVSQPATSPLPSNFQLEQNYPNPFNPTTVIEYSIPKETHVALKIYDVLGQEVETLVNENQNVGRYEVNFDGSRLASGVYFYGLVAGSHVIMKKMLMLK